MIVLKTEVRGLIPLQSRLRLTPNQIDIAMQRAIIKTTRAVTEAEVDEMNRCFDAPTKFTLNSLTTKFDQQQIVGTVEIKDGYWTRSQNYLETQMVGGKRRMKAFEKALQRAGVMPAGALAVPGAGAEIDAFGNMSVGQIRQILSWFDAAEMVAGSTQNMGEKGRAKKRKGTRKSQAFEYFAAMSGSRTGGGSWKNGRAQNLQPGIYKRVFFGQGNAIKPVLIFVTGASYKQRFKFDDVANKTIDRVLVPSTDAAIQRELDKL